jgi:hypothetical protein
VRDEKSIDELMTVRVSATAETRGDVLEALADLLISVHQQEQSETMAQRNQSYCTIEEAEEEGDSGREQPCIYATCNTTDHRVGPIWGQHEGSIRRALATLSKECSCNRYHVMER